MKEFILGYIRHRDEFKKEQLIKRLNMAKKEYSLQELNEYLNQLIKKEYLIYNKEKDEYSTIQKIRKDEIRTYIKDYDNIKNREEISVEEFTKIIKDTYPEYEVITEKTKSWTNKEITIVASVKKGREYLMSNKYFICIEEASKTKEGLVIGIHDKEVFKAVIEKEI